MKIITAIIVLIALCTITRAQEAETTPSKTIEGIEKLNTNFENGLISPWQKGIWNNSGKKPTVFEVSIYSNPLDKEALDYNLCIEASGDSTSKRVSAMLYTRISIKPEDGKKLVLTYDILNDKDKGFALCHPQLIILSAKNGYLGETKVVKDQTTKASLKSDQWNSATITAMIPDNTKEPVSYIQVKFSFIKDGSNPEETYRSYINNIKLFQQK